MSRFYGQCRTMLTLVVYDIADNRRRLRLSNFLLGQGRRVQESVFECFVPLDRLQKLQEQVQRRINPAEDNVRLYWIPADAVPRVLTIGSAPPEPPPKVYIV
jgi:CRISPR-associated protein Cas2